MEPGAYRTKIFDENAVIAAGFDNSQSPYYDLGRQMRRKLDARTANPAAMKDPEVVARLVENIIKKTKPRLRYAAGGRAKLLIFLSRVLPGRLFQALVAKASGHRMPAP